MPGPSFDRFATRHLGLVTTAELARLGWSDNQIRHAVGTRTLHPMRRGVFRVAGAPRSTEQAWLAAALAAPGSFLSHLTATTVWAVPCFPRPDLIDLVRVSSRPRLDGVRGHQTDRLPTDHVTRRRSLPATTPARTLVDTCGSVSPKQLRTGINDLRRRRLVSIPGLVRAVDDVPPSGRRAIAPMADYLEAHVPGYDLGDSDPEIDLVETLVAAGFPRPAQQVPVVTSVGIRFVDVGWPERRLGYEYDSVEFHEVRFHEDRDRIRALKRAGWDVWPITKTTSRNEVLAIATLAFRHEPAL